MAPTPFLAQPSATAPHRITPTDLAVIALSISLPPYRPAGTNSFVDHQDVLETGSHPLPTYFYPWCWLTWGSGPHTCSRRSYTCNAPDCVLRTPFKTKQALNRHYEVIHLAVRINCPVLGCENIGEKGIKRYDNLVAHVRNTHGDYQLVDYAGSTWLIRRAFG